MKKRVLALLLCLCVLLTTVPIEILAGGPVSPAGGGNTMSAMTIGTPYIEDEDTVHFGPCSWYVMDAHKANNGDGNKMFLFSNSVFTDGDLQFTNGEYGNSLWRGSLARAWCGNFLTDSFNSQEQEAIYATDKNDSAFTYRLADDPYRSERKEYCEENSPFEEKIRDEILFLESNKILQGDKVFFLSAEEARMRELREVPDENLALRRITQPSSALSSWYLRSRVSGYEIGIVSTFITREYDEQLPGGYDDTHFMTYYRVSAGNRETKEYAVPALNLNLDKVLFASAANGKGSGEIGAQALREVSSDRPEDWKMTLYDSSRNGFSVSNPFFVDSTNTVYFDYFGATTGNNEYISALIMEEGSQNVSYYGRILKPNSASGKASVDLTGIDMTGKKLYIYSEQFNGNNSTDMASELSEVSLDRKGYHISLNLENVEVEGPELISYSDHYSATFASARPWIMPTEIRVWVGGEELTASDYTYIRDNEDEGSLTIPKDKITDNISIQARGKETYTLEASSTSHGFRSLESGYEDPPFVEIAFKNVGSEPLFLNEPTTISGNYDLELSKARLTYGETTGVTVRPKIGLPPGNYDDVLSLTATNGVSAHVEIFLNVYDSSHSSAQGEIAFGDKIYFGTDGERPNKWRVLDPNQTNDGQEGIFLISDGLISNPGYKGYYNYELGQQANRTEMIFGANSTWQGSTAQLWCQEFFSNNLTLREQGALMATYKSDRKYIVNDAAKMPIVSRSAANILYGDKVFFLSAEEADNPLYGFFDDNVRLQQRRYGDYMSYAWWLRSPVNDTTALYIEYEGDFSASKPTTYNNHLLYSPAFNLDREAILFFTAAIGSKISQGPGTPLVYEIDPGHELKLTLLDESRSGFSANIKEVNGHLLTIDYSNATYGPNEYVSALVKDKDGKIAYYGRIAEIESAEKSNGQALINLSGIDMGDKEVYVISEQCNGDKKTDYASPLQPISLSLEEWAVSYSLKNLSTDGSLAYPRLGGQAYEAQLSPDPGYRLPDTISVIVGGEALAGGTDYSYENGLVTIPAEKITGPIRISGRAVSFTYGISIDKDSLDFGSGPLDYSQPDAQTITIENTGQEMVIVDLPGNENYIIEADTGFDSHANKASLNAGATASFTVQPKSDLPAGTYNTMVTIRGSNNTKAKLSLEFSVWKSGDTLFGQLGKWQRFYYGKDGDNPIPWTVLDANKASNGDEGMFALSDIGFNAGRTQAEANEWCEDFYNDYLTPSEQASLLATHKREDKYLVQYARYRGLDIFEWFNEPSYVNELKGAHVFSLSYKEAMDSRYGLSNPDTRKAKNNQDWWLRTAVELYRDVRPIGVKSDGVFEHLRDSDRRGMRPAFNLDKSFLLFASPAEGGKPADLGSSLKACNYQAAEWKLTVSDSNYNQFIAKTLTIGGDTLTIGYLGAVHGSNEYISALVKDEDGRIAYYGRLAKIDALDKVAGQVEINLAGIDMTDKELYVFNEQCNGDKLTDYASELQSVSLTDIAYPVSYELTNISSDGYPFYRIDSANDYSASFLADKFYALPETIEVTVGGIMLAGAAYTYSSENGKLLIEKSAITGRIEITAAGLPVEIAAIEASKLWHDFGNIYKTVSAWTVDLENTGSMELTVKLPISENYIIEGGEGFDAESKTATLAPGSLASFTVMPKDNLEEGDYEDKLLINTEGDVTILELTTYFSNWSQAVPRRGHHVYLGMSGEENIKWRILDPDKTSTASEGVFLMAEDLYDNLAFDNTAPYSSAWKNSNAQSWAENFYEKHITPTERDAVLKTTKGNDLKGDKVFFLSEEEARKDEYGFRMAEDRIAGYGGSPSSWLLRSPSTVDNSSIGIVKEDGTISLDNVQSTNNKARPALNLDGGQVLFMIPAIDIGVDAYVDRGELVAIPSDTTEWKLTLYDSRHDTFNCATTGVEGNKLTIRYNSELPRASNNYISAIVKDEHGQVTHYGNIVRRSYEQQVYSCTMELDLPAGFDPDKDEVYLLQEKRNGNKPITIVTSGLIAYKDGYENYNNRANLGSALRKVSVTGPEAWAVDTDLGEKVDSYGDAYYRFEDQSSGKPYTAKFTRSDGKYLPDMISVKVGEKVLEAGIDYTYVDGQLVIPADSIDGPIKISHHEYSFKVNKVEANGVLDFGRVAPGYNRRPASFIILSRDGGGSIVNLPTSDNFEITGDVPFMDGKVDLSIFYSATFHIKPKDNLPPGVYDEKISITTEEGEVLSFYATFTVSHSPIAKKHSIYFGDTEWLVLDDNKTNMDTPGLFLMSKEPLWYNPFETNESRNYNYGYVEHLVLTERETVNWQESSSRIRCQDFYDNSLSPLEQAAVIATTKSDSKYLLRYYAPTNNDPPDTSVFEEGQEILKDDKIFFLSAEEALNPTYGPLNYPMWLRSRTTDPGRPNIGIISEYYGKYSFYDADPFSRTFNAHPVFNLDPDQVVFASPAEGGKAGGVGEKLQPIPSEVPASWKLTLHDPSRQGLSCVTSKVDVDNKTLTINYSGAVIGDNEYLSALIKDSYGNITHCGKLVKPNRDTGSVVIRLPESFDMEQDSLWVFSEQCNGDKKSDYASALQAVSLEPYSHAIGFDLAGMTKDGLNYHPIASEEDYTVRLIPNSGYSLPENITISLGEDTLNEHEDYTYSKENGQVVISWEKIRGALTITAIANKLAIEVSPSTIDFGKIEPGDPLPDETVTITNTGNQKIGLNQPLASGKNLTIGDLGASELDPGESTNFTIGLKDIEALPSGTYTETIMLTGNDDISQTISLNFTVWKNDINFRDKIYFGTFDGKPIPWLVLDPNETNDGKKGMLLLSEMTLEDIYFQESPTYLYNSTNSRIYAFTWQASVAQAWCKNFYQNNLVGLEQAAILTATYDSLMEDRIFFLSEDEVKSEKYGFKTHDHYDVNRLTISLSTGEVSDWYLRTPGSLPGDLYIVNSAGMVARNNVYTNNATPLYSARPAFNLDKDQILFTTAAFSGKLSGPVGPGALRQVGSYQTDSLKLTLLDSKRSGFTARTTARAGDLLTITYTGAIQGSNEYISALVRNESGEITYYGRVSKVSAPEGRIEIKLPSGFDESKDSLYVFNEEYNGDYKSDFSSPIHELSTNIGDWMVSYELEGLQTDGLLYHEKLATEDYRGKLYVELGYGLPESIEIRVGGSLLGNGDYTYSPETGDIVIPFDQITGQVTITATGVESSSGPEIEFSTNSLDFGRLNSNYTPKAQRLTIKNIGKESIILPPPQTANGYFLITADDLDIAKNYIRLEAGASTGLKIQPKPSLKVGNYKDTYLIGDKVLDLSLTVWSSPISSGHQLYFGSKPIVWNILDPAQTNMGTPGIFLLKDTLAGYRDDLGSSNAAFRSYDGSNISWQDSLAKAWADKFYLTNLTPIEKTAVLATYKSDSIGYEAYKRLNGDKMFFLSMEEMLNPAYGFDYDGTIDTPNESRVATLLGQSREYYTRTPIMFDEGYYHNPYNKTAVVVSARGEVKYMYYNDRQGKDYPKEADIALPARPAFNLDWDSIVFLSGAFNGKESGELGAGALKALSSKKPLQWKATLLDPDRSSFAVSSVEQTGNSLIFNYTGAIPIQPGKAPNEYISALLMNSNEEIIYYGNIASPESANGAATIDLSGIDMEGKSLYVISEQCNGDAMTDYSSPMVPLSFAPLSTYVLTVNGGTGAGSYVEGYNVTITAGLAPEGQEFDKWTTEDGVVFADASATTTSFTMPGKAVEVTATYKDQDTPSTIAGVTVTPKTITIEKGKTGQFNATVTGTGAFDDTVEWTVTGGSSGTSISDTGLLTIAADETATSLTVIATSNGDTSKSDSALVTVSDTPPVTYHVTVENDGNGSAEAAPSVAGVGVEISLTATANAGYQFKEWEVIVGTVTITSDKFTMPDSDVTVKAIFEPVPITITGITVKAAPIKVTYTVGEALELAGLVVTLTNSDNTTEDVAFADFGAKGIIASPAGGSLLAITDTKVTITHSASGKTVDQAITVNAIGAVDPVEDTAVSATAVTLGDTLAASTLSGTFKDPLTSDTVAGTLAWADSSIVVNASGDFGWTFTPDNAAAYKAISGTVNVVANPIPVSTDATLSNLEVNGTTITGFSSSIETYNVELATGTTTVPTVVATVSDTGKATAVVADAENLPGTTVVTVTAEDGTTKKTYKVNFTVAPPVTVTGITIKAAPTKVVYTEGESLALTGLVVTLTNSDNTTKDVAFADFGAKGIIASPAGGSLLAITDTKVTITHSASGKTVDQAITVNAIGAVDPVEDTAVSATAVTLGDILAASTLSGTFKDPSTNLPVAGTLAWTDSSIVVNATGDFGWTFTPDNAATYKVISGTVNVLANPIPVSTDASITGITVAGEAATLDGVTGEYSVVLPYGTDLSVLTATDVAVTATDTNATVGVATTTDGGATWTAVVTAEDGTTKATYIVKVSVKRPSYPPADPTPSVPAEPLPEYIVSELGSTDGAGYDVLATTTLSGSIAAAKAEGETSWHMGLTGVLPEDANEGPLHLSVPAALMEQLAGLELLINTPYGDIGLPKELVEALAAAGEGLTLSISTVDEEESLRHLAPGDSLLTSPVDIGTAIQGPTLVTLVCDLPLPQGDAEREAFLAGLYVLAIHGEDDWERIQELEFHMDEEETRLLGVTFRVERFSTFVLVIGDSAAASPLQLNTKIGSNSYTLAGEAKTFDNLTAYRVDDGTTVMAIRLLEELGAIIGYRREGGRGVATVAFNGTHVTLREGSRVMVVVQAGKEREVALRTPFTNLDGRTYLPTRDVMENLGFLVHWEAAGDTITILAR